VPDVPGVGWMDDFFILASAILNFWQYQVQQRGQKTAIIWIKRLKWIMVFFAVSFSFFCILFGALVIKSLIK
jgi:hypothetical protein